MSMYPWDGTGIYTTITDCKTICNSTGTEEDERISELDLSINKENQLTISLKSTEKYQLEIYSIDRKKILSKKYPQRRYYRYESILKRGIHGVDFK